MIAMLSLYKIRSTFSDKTENGKIKVACIGDSLTFGAMVFHRQENCYPAQLQKLLGEDYFVYNFGANSHKAQKGGAYSYWNHRYFQLSQQIQPNIVLLMLGTNDSKQANWCGIEAYLNDYRDLITQYRALPSNPQVFIMTLPTAYIKGNHHELHFTMQMDAILEMVEAQRQLAECEGLPLIDTHSATSGMPEAFVLDGIHANVQGAKIIAQTAYDALWAIQP